MNPKSIALEGDKFMVFKIGSSSLGAICYRWDMSVMTVIVVGLRVMGFL